MPEGDGLEVGDCSSQYLRTGCAFLWSERRKGERKDSIMMAESTKKG